MLLCNCGHNLKCWTKIMIQASITKESELWGQMECHCFEKSWLSTNKKIGIAMHLIDNTKQQ